MPSRTLTLAPILKRASILTLTQVPTLTSSHAMLEQKNTITTSAWEEGDIPSNSANVITTPTELIVNNNNGRLGTHASHSKHAQANAQHNRMMGFCISTCYGMHKRTQLCICPVFSAVGGTEKKKKTRRASRTSKP